MKYLVRNWEKIIQNIFLVIGTNFLVLGLIILLKTFFRPFHLNNIINYLRFNLVCL